MYQLTRLNSDQNFFQKIKNLDFILLICILILSRELSIYLTKQISLNYIYN